MTIFRCLRFFVDSILSMAVEFMYMSPAPKYYGKLPKWRLLLDKYQLISKTSVKHLFTFD